MTVKDAILAEIKVRLLAMDPAPASVEIEPSGDPDEFDAIELYDDGDVILERDAACTRKQMSLRLSGMVEGSAGDAPTAARNDLHARCVAALLADGSLGGLVELIDEGDRRNATAILAEKRRLGFDQDFSIQFTTMRDNPALAA